MGPLQRSQSHPGTQFCWPSTRTSRAGGSPQVPSPGPCSCGRLPNCQRHLPGQKTGNPDAGFSASPSYSQSSLLPTASGDVLLILSTFILILLRAQPSIHFSHSPFNLLSSRVAPEFTFCVNSHRTQLFSSKHVLCLLPGKQIPNLQA